MRSILKILGGIVGVLLLLAVVAVAIFAFTFDADDYKATVQTLVKNQTGRDLVIDGDLSVSYFPWLGFDVGPTRLADGAGYGDEPFARFESASARVRLLPLLRKKIEIGGLTLDGLDLKLVRNADGTTNWDDLAAGDDAATQKDEEQGSGATALRIGGIRLTDADVSFTDRGTGAVYKVSDFNLETGELEPGKPFDLTTRLAFTASEPAVSGTLNAAGTLTSDIEAGSFRLDSPKIALTASGTGLPAGEVVVELDGDGLEMAGEKIAASAPVVKLRLTGGDLPLDSLVAEIVSPMITVDGEDILVGEPAIAFEGEGTGDKPLHALTGKVQTGSIRVTGGDAYTLPATKLDVSAGGPALPGGKKADIALSFAGVTGSIERGTATIDNATMAGLGLNVTAPKITGSSLNETPQFAGTLNVAEFSPRRLARDLAIELPTTSDESVLTKLSGSTTFSAGTDRFALSKAKLKLDDSALSGDFSVRDFEKMALRFDLDVDRINVDRYLAPPEEPDESRPVDAIEIPSEQLRALDAQGTLRIGELVFAGIRSTDVRVGVDAKNGSTRIFPSQAKLYGGTYNGDIRIDATGAKPRMSINETLSGVSFGELSRDMFQADKLTGKVEGRVTLEAVGDEISELRQTLNGTAQFSFADGAYEGVDLWHEISRAVALVKKDPVPSGAGKGRTEFSQMRGSATVTNGIVRSEDLSVALPFMRVGGQGLIDLVQQSIDYRLKATVIKSPELTDEAATLAGRTIPVSITGDLGDPKVRPDVQAMLAGAVKDKIEEKIEDKLGDVLGGVLGRKDKDAPAPSADPSGDQAATASGDAAEKSEPKKTRPEDLLRGLLGGGTSAPEQPVDDPAAEGEPAEPPPEEKKRPEDVLKDLLGGG